jgi:hypothetical protein
MGNFSRDTFDPAKRYVAVRLQQGVPLVDADWNELQDVTRNELYDGLGVGVPDAVTRGGLTLAGIGDNDLTLSPGTAVLAGRPLRLSAQLRYSTQRYANAATATADGVPVAGPLTTPTTDRTDLAYLDVWEREVASAEDPSLVNAAIGVETSVRRRRELALRVSEGTQAPPQPAAGHQHLPLARLRRLANTAAIGVAQIEAVQPMAPLPGSRKASFAPAFPALRDTLVPQWQVAPDLTDIGGGQVIQLPTLFAFKDIGQAADGTLELSLPDGARLLQLRCVGLAHAPLTFGLVRVKLAIPSGLEVLSLATDTVTNGVFNREVAISAVDGRNMVDNSQYMYLFTARCSDTITFVTIRGITVRYDP